jgi:hypothetical protein
MPDEYSSIVRNSDPNGRSIPQAKVEVRQGFGVQRFGQGQLLAVETVAHSAQGAVHSQTQGEGRWQTQDGLGAEEQVKQVHQQQLRLQLLLRPSLALSMQSPAGWVE